MFMFVAENHVGCTRVPLPRATLFTIVPIFFSFLFSIAIAPLKVFEHDLIHLMLVRQKVQKSFLFLCYFRCFLAVKIEKKMFRF